MSSIVGVERKSLTAHPDGRGFFREVIRNTESIFEGAALAQWSHSRMANNVVKAWHFHHLQTDWWYVSRGLIRVVLIDNREESPTYQEKLDFLMGEGEQPNIQSQVIRIPPGVLHSLKVLSEQADLLYITDRVYDPQDEGRIPYNDPEIGLDWGEGVVVAERDTKLFIPPYERITLKV